MTTLEDQAKQIFAEESAKFNYNGKIDIGKKIGKPSFSGCMDMLTAAKIKLEFNPNYPDEDLEHIVKDPFKVAFTALADHELNHKGGGKNKGCPRNMDLHVESVVEPMSDALKKLGFPNVMVNPKQPLYA